MSSPFKVGDKVTCIKVWHDIDITGVGTVCEVFHPTADDPHQHIKLAECMQSHPHHKFKSNRYAAVTASMAPDVPPNDLYPSGHLPDGSSVQKHSAGELYPYVVAYRDSTDPHSARKYDVGLLGPRVVGTAWFTSFEDAVAVATALKA